MESIHILVWTEMIINLKVADLSRGCLQFVIVVFPDHTHLLFLVIYLDNSSKTARIMPLKFM